MTYISNLRKIGQKLRSLSRVIGTSYGQTDRHMILYLSNAMNCIGQTIKDVNWCAHAYTGKNLRISARGILHVPKAAKNGYF